MVKSMYIKEPGKNIEVLGTYDVAVCGAGPAGCAAAIAAARMGAKTILLEKDGFCGGALVSQLVCVILSTNTVDFQGIWHEFAAWMKEHDGAYLRKPANLSTGHYNGSFSPELAKHAWDYLLAEAGVEVLFHVHTSTAIVDNGVASGIIAEMKSGRKAILAKRVIDCTGDGIVAAQAGVGFEQGDGINPYAMALTKVFRMAGVSSEPLDFCSDETMNCLRGRLEAAVKAGKYTQPVITEMNRLLGYIKSDVWRLPAPRCERMSVISRILQTDPLDPFQISRAEINGRKQAMEASDFYRSSVPGFENAYLLDTSNHIGVRSSRRLQGIDRVSDDDAWSFKKRPDSIARSSWEIDVWPADSYSKPAVAHEDRKYAERAKILRDNKEYFDIPYGCIVCRGIDNLLMGGRCISAGHLAESSLRIQQTCMSTGEAAGTTAAISISEDCTPRELDSSLVINELEKKRTSVAPAFEVLESESCL